MQVSTCPSILVHFSDLVDRFPGGVFMAKRARRRPCERSSLRLLKHLGVGNAARGHPAGPPGSYDGEGAATIRRLDPALRGHGRPTRAPYLPHTTRR
jgi:hypothetical protein